MVGCGGSILYHPFRQYIYIPIRLTVDANNKGNILCDRTFDTALEYRRQTTIYEWRVKNVMKNQCDLIAWRNNNIIIMRINSRRQNKPTVADV